METHVLVNALRELVPAQYEWKFAMYSTHKSRDGIELDIHSCKMNAVSSLIEQICAVTLEKSLSERTVAEYSPLLPKELIGAVENSNDLISVQISDILTNTENALEYSPEDFISGALSAPRGYIFFGYQKDESGKITDKILFMKRTNPFISRNKTRLCVTSADEITESGKPVLKFAHTADLIMTGDICYFINAAIEKDFGLLDRQIAICEKRLAVIAEANIINNYDQLEDAAYKNARKFIDFDRSVLEYIERLPLVEREDFLTTYGITVDKEGRMDTRDPEQCELIIDLLCCRSCLDPLGRLSVGSNITPR